MKVTGSDKLDNKPTEMDTDLALVIEAWPNYPKQSVRRL